MKKKFSTKWKSSKQPRKQRKYIANAPLHARRKLMSALLSRDLRKKYSRKNIPVRKGDTVKILRGSHRGKSGKIANVDSKNIRVFVENIHFIKKDGSKASVPLHPSNLLIENLVTDDRKRRKALERTIMGMKK